MELFIVLGVALVLVWVVDRAFEQRYKGYDDDNDDWPTGGAV